MQKSNNSFGVFLLAENTFSAIWCGVTLGCISSSILYFIDALLKASTAGFLTSEPTLSQIDMAGLAVVAILFAPAFETLIFQVLVFELIGVDSLSKLKKAMVVSTLLFSGVHYISGGFEQVLKMILVGGMLSSGYAWARGKSMPSAIALTISAHTAHNAVLIIAEFIWASSK
ncbi:CPBP family glutamic-type intramembrane protease [Massilia sp. SYSU DXS3249]